MALSEELDDLHHLLPGRPGEEHDNNEAPAVRLLIAGFPDRLEIGK